MESRWKRSVRSVARRISRRRQRENRRDLVQAKDAWAQSSLAPLAGSVDYAEWEKARLGRSGCAWRVERSSDSGFGPIRKTLWAVGDWIGCHQLPERSLYFRHTQFPVCARCTGVIIGQATAVLAAVVGIHAGTYAGLIMMAPMGTDWAVQYMSLRESTNTRRLITGLLGGAGYMTVLLSILALIMKKMP